MHSKVLYCLLTACFLTALSPLYPVHAADEPGTRLTPLYENFQVRQYLKENPYRPAFKKSDTADLPFFDDFSSAHVHPLDSLWLDNNVFINNSYPINPISVNVATFDGLNALGQPYDPSNPNSINETADTLTSVPINLQGLTEADNLYLSFFYQPQGLGDPPEEADKLVLEFKPDSFNTENGWNSDDWIRVWEQSGRPLEDFRIAMIQLESKIDTNFFHSAFQFRFISYANRSGNLDHWHVDYVYLNNNRSPDDTTRDDITVVNRPFGLLQNYRSMPKNHVTNDELRTELPVVAHNLDNQIRNVEYTYLVRNPENNDTLIDPRDLEGFGDNVNPWERRTFTRENKVDITNISEDYFELEISMIARTGTDFNNWNDTSRIIQEFEQYLAYDDGIAEAGWNIQIGSLPQGMAAQRYHLNGGDSLRAVGIHFNRSGEDVSDRRIDLMIWDEITNPDVEHDDNDKVLYSKQISPQFTDERNGFYIYWLDEPVFVHDEFYVGWRQRDNFWLNIGIDMTYDRFRGEEGQPNPNLFYNLHNHWERADVTGALMIRPYLNVDDYLLVGNKPRIKSEKEYAEPLIYPNPASDYFSLKNLSHQPVNYTIYDMQGRRQLEGTAKNNDRISVKALNKGIYFLNVEMNNGRHSRQKLIVN